MPSPRSIVFHNPNKDQAAATLRLTHNAFGSHGNVMLECQLRATQSNPKQVRELVSMGDHALRLQKLLDRWDEAKRRPEGGWEEHLSYAFRPSSTGAATPGEHRRYEVTAEHDPATGKTTAATLRIAWPDLDVQKLLAMLQEADPWLLSPAVAQQVVEKHAVLQGQEVSLPQRLQTVVPIDFSPFLLTKKELRARFRSGALAQEAGGLPVLYEAKEEPKALYPVASAPLSEAAKEDLLVLLSVLYKGVIGWRKEKQERSGSTQSLPDNQLTFAEFELWMGYLAGNVTKKVYIPVAGQHAGDPFKELAGKAAKGEINPSWEDIEKHLPALYAEISSDPKKRAHVIQQAMAVTFGVMHRLDILEHPVFDDFAYSTGIGGYQTVINRLPDAIRTQLKQKGTSLQEVLDGALGAEEKEIPPTEEVTLPLEAGRGLKRLR